MNRIIHKPAITLENWMISKGVPESDIMTDTDIVNFLGGALTERTRSGRGKIKKHGRKIILMQAMAVEYKKEIESGNIPMIETEVPLDMTNESDCAYARAMLRRQEVLKNKL